MNETHFCIIMAGGIGSRFWPQSRLNKPKQFLDVLGMGQTLLQQTYKRALNIFLPENIYIVTNKRYKTLVIEQLPGIDEDLILLEPQQKNTANCIAFANYRIQQRTTDAIIAVAPCDHLITNDTKYTEVVKAGLEFVDERNALLTLGLTPLRPETGYGYIQYDTDASSVKQDNHLVHKVKTFTEKPSYEIAKIFVEAGEFLWNSGIFIWSLDAIKNAFKVYLPEIYASFEMKKETFGTEHEAEALNEIYSDVPNISIDFGIMEHAENVYVLPADFSWTDLGTWDALNECSPKDPEQNVVLAPEHLIYDTKNCIIAAPKDKLVIVHGLDDYLVIDNNDVLMVCKRGDNKLLRRFLNDVNIDMDEKFL